MKSLNKSFLLCLIAMSTVLCCTRCSVKKKVVVEEPKILILVDTVTDKPEDYLKYSLDFSTFSGKADAYYKDNKQDQNLKATIKMKKNEETYLSAQALAGLVEAMAALARPDSLMALDRINRKKYLLSYQDGLSLIKVPISYSSLQNLFMGNPLLDASKVTSFVKGATEAEITLKDNSQEVKLYYDLNDKRLLRQQVVDISKNFSATIVYAQYQLVNNAKSFAMSHDINILMNGQASRVLLEYNSVTLDQPVEYKFNVPRSYDLVPIKK